MDPRPLERRARTLLRVITLVAAALLALWVFVGYARGWTRQVQSVEDLRVRVMLTLLGIAIAAALTRWLLYASRVFPRAAAAGLLAWSLATVCYLLLVWTSLKIHPPLWRVWWVSCIGTLAAAIAMALRLPSTGRRGTVERAAAACLVVLAVLVGSLAFRADVLSSPGPLFIWTTLTLLAVVLCGSLMARVRYARARAPRPVRRWQRLAWVVTGQAGLVAIGFYAGRVTQPPPVPGVAAYSELAVQPEAQIASQVDADLRRLQALTVALHDLRSRAYALRESFAPARARDGRAYYTPVEADQLRPVFVGYLACRDAMLRMIATYSGFAHVRDPTLRARCFLVGFGAGSTLYANSLRLVAFGDDPIVRRRLNEAEPAWELAAGQFDRIQRAVASDATAGLYEEMAAYYAANKSDWARQGVLPPEEMAWLTKQIDAGLDEVRLLDIDRDRARWQLLAARVRADAYNPLYVMQSAVSTWIGDTRLVARPSFISPQQIKAIQPRLQPGDILLERRNWFASNAFLPGFWPHAALYVGSPQELEQLGVIRRQDGRWTSDDPHVEARLPDYLEHAHDGEPHTVVESVSEGVIFNSLTHSMAADYVAVLRPRNLSPDDRAKAIRTAFGHVGKPYDFEFDFATADKLVCTELVYQCYDTLLDFDCDPSRPGEQLPQIMGRAALPALEFCRKFARERGSPERELDLILFLDAEPAQRAAREADAQAFCDSADRPRGFNE